MTGRKKIYDSKIYRAWAHMKQRCNNSKSKQYHLWGGRGISYDKRWEKFSEFYKDMNNGCEEGMSLDRIDTNKDYSKENCRWATPLQQANNTRQNRKIKWKDKEMSISAWSRELNIKRSTITQRLNVYGWDIDKCFSTR